MASTLTSTMAPPAGDARLARAPYAAFLAFGAFWGAWGAALPALRTGAGVSEGQLGTALLCVGLGALPSMALTDRAVDRGGLRVAAWLLGGLAGAGMLITSTAHGVLLLVAGMLLVGAASGATDVAINTLAARAEHASDGPVIARSHGLFSIGVVLSSVAAGALLGGGLSLPGAFGLVAATMLGLAAAVARWSRGLDVVAGWGAEADGHEPVAAGESLDEAEPRGDGRGPRASAPLLVVGLVAALAYAIENAHQSWGALMLTDVFTATPQLAAAAPAAFAATAALARLGLAPLTRSRATAVLLGGGALATLGSALLAGSPTVAVALAGLVLAALGTATLFPTLLSRSLRNTHPEHHARATSRVSTTAYLGFLVGPAYVGLLADRYGLRVALAGVAVLAAVFTAVAGPVTSWASRAGGTREARGAHTLTTS